MVIYVMTAARERVELEDVTPSHTVSAVKGMLEEKIGFDESVDPTVRRQAMSLSFLSSPLEDHRTMDECKIRQGSTLDLDGDSRRYPSRSHAGGAAEMSGSEEEAEEEEPWNPGSGSEAEEDSGEESEAFEPDADYDDGELGDDVGVSDGSELDDSADEDGSELEEDEAEGGAEPAPVFGN